jgi:K+-transporting ATPase ATPase C chain
MDVMKKSVLSTLCLMAVLSGIYPLMVYLFGQLFFHKNSHGSLIIQNQQIVGSRLIGKNFEGPLYFHPRPSSAGKNGYDASNSSGSNLGPTSKQLIETVRKRIADYRTINSIAPDVLIPADAVTASASGLDPHISFTNALLQAPRVAKARGISEKKIYQLIEKHTDGRLFGLWGEPRVNVVLLNLELWNSF